MRKLLTLIFFFVVIGVLVIWQREAHSGLGGFGGSGIPAQMADVVFSSGGPFAGVTPFRHMMTFEEFDKNLDDVDDPDATPPEWPNSGWVQVIKNGAIAPVDENGNHLRVIGEGVLMVSAGSAPNTGIFAQHDTRTRLAATPGTLFKLPFFKWAVWQNFPEGPLGGYNLHFAAEVGIGGTVSPWASDALIGFAFAETGIMPDTTGTVTCGTSWASTGGIVFQMDRSRNLKLMTCNATAGLQTRSVSLSGQFADGGNPLRLGFSFITTDIPGDGTLQGFYQVTTGDQPIVWTALSTPITGTYFPYDNGPSRFTVEVQNGATLDHNAQMAVDWVASAVTKETMIGTF